MSLYVVLKTAKPKVAAECGDGGEPDLNPILCTLAGVKWQKLTSFPSVAMKAAKDLEASYGNFFNYEVCELVNIERR